MNDYDWVDNAITMLETAEVINKFTETVWVCVDRHAWDQFCATQGVQDANKCIFQTQERGQAVHL